MDVTNKQLRLHAAPPIESAPLQRWRWLGVTVGLGTQLLFLFTVWHLFFFLKNGAPSNSTPTRTWKTLLLDTGLLLQFAIIHSTLLYPRVQKLLTKWIPRPFYGCMFCITTCVTLLAVIFYWAPSQTIVFDIHSNAGLWAMSVCYYGSWMALFYSLYISGLGYQTGWTPFWYWFRKQPQPRREFEEKGAYKIFRHPIYLSFLGLIWFTPHMTLDHLALTGLWTVYIFFGSYLKDQRLVFYVGDKYREYQQRVPGYPLLHWGPLGYRKADPITLPINPPALASPASKKTA